MSTSIIPGMYLLLGIHVVLPLLIHCLFLRDNVNFCESPFLVTVWQLF